MSLKLKPRAVLVTIAAALVLAACGRRGDLEPPPSPNAVQTPVNNHKLDLHRTNPKITPPKKAFILDPLLQ